MLIKHQKTTFSLCCLILEFSYSMLPNKIQLFFLTETIVESHLSMLSEISVYSELSNSSYSFYPIYTSLPTFKIQSPTNNLTEQFRDFNSKNCILRPNMSTNVASPAFNLYTSTLLSISRLPLLFICFGSYGDELPYSCTIQHIAMHSTHSLTESALRRHQPQTPFIRPMHRAGGMFQSI